MKNQITLSVRLKESHLPLITSRCFLFTPPRPTPSWSRMYVTILTYGDVSNLNTILHTMSLTQNYMSTNDLYHNKLSVSDAGLYIC